MGDSKPLQICSKHIAYWLKEMHEPCLFSFPSQTPVLLTPSPLPSTIHFWSTLSPIAPHSPAKLSFQVRIPLPSSAFTLLPASQHGHIEPSAASQRPALLLRWRSAWSTAPGTASLQTRTHQYQFLLFQTCENISFFLIRYFISSASASPLFSLYRLYTKARVLM